MQAELYVKFLRLILYPAQMVVCADGGANRLFELQLQADEENACVGHQQLCDYN